MPGSESPDMSERTPKTDKLRGAVGFDRPLLLTPGENLAGYVLSKVGRAIFFLITCASVLAVLLIFLFVLKETAGFIVSTNAEGEWVWHWDRLGEHFSSTSWYPERDRPEYGGLSLVAGSLYVTLLSLAIAVPLGVMAAVFLSDVVPFKVRQVVKPVVELLAAIPSVALGAFAALVVAPWMQNSLGFSSGVNVLNAGVILAIMAVPTIVSVSEDALTAVGRELREGSYALGATRAETIFKVVIPAGRSGIVAAVILGMMRVIGETMVVWMAAGNAAKIPAPWWDLSQSVRTMTATIAAEMGEAPRGTPHYYVLFLVGAVLLVFTFILNIVSEHFIVRAKRTMSGKAKA